MLNLGAPLHAWLPSAASHYVPVMFTLAEDLCFTESVKRVQHFD